MLTLFLASALATSSVGLPQEAPLPPKAPTQQTDPLAAFGAAPESHSSAPIVLPVLALLGLAGAAAVLARRKSRGTHWVQVLDTASLGPKRSLVVAQMLGETLLLGVSEAGIVVLSTRQSTSELLAAADAKQLNLSPAPVERPPGPAPFQESIAPTETPARMGTGLASLFSKVTGAPGTHASFDSFLVESAEDLELRNKLAAGHRGNVK